VIMIVVVMMMGVVLHGGHRQIFESQCS
jgi:hypothetical protein